MNKEPLVDNLDEAVRKFEETEELKNNTQEIEYNATKIMWKKVSYVVIMLAVLCIIVSMYLFVNNRIPKNKQIEYMGTTFKISTYTDELQYLPTHISTNLGDFNAEFDIDISDCVVNSFDNYDNYTYLAYTSEDGNLFTEVIVSDTLPAELEIEADILNELKNQNKTVSTIEDGDITIEKAYINLFNKGYLIVIQQANSSEQANTYATKMINTISDCMLYSSNKKITNEDKRLYIEVDGLATLDLNKLTVLNGKAGVYFGQDNVLRLYNYESDISYAYITNIENKYMMNKSSNLKQVDGWNNLYYDVDKESVNRMGYRAFGVQTNKGFYYIKIDENAPQGLEDEIIEWLGIKQEDKKIDTIFE